jgi:hypothetical protein
MATSPPIIKHEGCRSVALLAGEIAQLCRRGVEGAHISRIPAPDGQ